MTSLPFQRQALIALLALSGCIQEATLGPDLGACADYPDAVYTYGEAGIGRCLAGPADVRFVEQNGEIYLAVSNANPLLSFSSGSVVLIPWSGIDLGRARNLMSEVNAAALPLDNYVGGLGFDSERDWLMVSSRLSAGATTRVENDEVLFVDLADPTAPQLLAIRDHLEVRDDPHPIVIDAETDRAYVVNLTDHSLSVVDLATDVPSLIDLSPSAGITAAAVQDNDASGTSGEITNRQVLNESKIRPDLWTLSWAAEPTRVWVPTSDGLLRHERAGTDFLATGVGVELLAGETDGVDEVRDPYVSGSGPTQLWFADGARLLTTQSGAAVSDWSLAAAVTVFDADEALLEGGIAGGPAPLSLETSEQLYFHVAAPDGGPESVVLRATFTGDSWTVASAPVLDPATSDTWLGYRHPVLINDPNTGSVRLWASAFDGSAWAVVTAESADGLTWDAEPTLVTSSTLGAMAAPHVTWTGTHYVVYATMWNGAGWEHRRGTSVDGVDWGELNVIATSDRTDPAEPPRLAVQTISSTGWLLEGFDSGLQQSLLTPGAPFVSSSLNFGLQLSHGFWLSGATFGTAGDSGVLPVSVVEVDGRQRVYVTATDSDGRSRIAVAERSGGGWRRLGTDLIPAGTGANVAGAAAPVVWGSDGAWEMVYTATDSFGRGRLYAATSADGLSWTANGSPLLTDGVDFDRLSREPHSVVVRDDGTIELWYAAFDGTRWRISRATRTGTAWARDASNSFLLGSGAPGALDATHARWPSVTTDSEGALRMLYAGFDGDEWTILEATSPDGAEWTRVTDSSGASKPLLQARSGTFAQGGVVAPVTIDAGDSRVVAYAGLDLVGGKPRVGLAQGGADRLFPADLRPTPGDTMTFRTRRSDPDGEAVIELAQTFDGFTTSGLGVSSARLDNERGWIWVTSKLSDYLYAIDVRDDSAGDVVDANVNNIEAVLVSSGNVRGFRDAIPLPGSNLLYATARDPDQVLVFDISTVVDDDHKDLVQRTPAASFALRAQETPTGAATRFEQAIGGSLLDRDEDEGAETSTQIGGAGLALTPDGSTLLVAHFRDNSVQVFDLEANVYGAPLARIPNVGEHPFVVRVHPDGLTAVVANYTGEIDPNDDTASSTMAIIDLDPTSETYLQVLTKLVNR